MPSIFIAGLWKKLITSPRRNYLGKEGTKRPWTISYRNQRVISWSMRSSFPIRSAHMMYAQLLPLLACSTCLGKNVSKPGPYSLSLLYLTHQKSFHYSGLLKAVMRLSMTNMKAADAKEVASSITAIANEKLKAEKEAAAGKKKQGMNRSLRATTVNLIYFSSYCNYIVGFSWALLPSGFEASCIRNRVLCL